MKTKANGSMVHVVVVSPYGISRDGLKSLLHSHGNVRVAGEARDAATAAEVVRQCWPDLVLIDTDTFSEPPAQAMRQMSQLLPNTRFVLVCRGAEVSRMSDLSELFAGGVKGVVLKEETSRVLLDAIQKVHAGELWFDRQTIARVLQNKNGENGADRLASLRRLSAREREVIALVGDGRKNRQIAEALSISEATVRNHLTSIFRKMRIRDRVELAIFVHRNGVSRSPLDARTPEAVNDQTHANALRGAERYKTAQ